MEWSRFFKNMVFGQRLVCLLSAQGSNAPPMETIAATTQFYLTSLTLFLRSHNFKSLLSPVATSAIFTQNTTVNWILLNSIGVPQNFTIGLQDEVQPLKLWKRR